MPIQINKGVIGKESPPFVVTVERGKIKEFARARNSWNVVSDRTCEVYAQLLAQGK